MSAKPFHPYSSTAAPPAMVTACRGAMEGTLGVARALGRRGVHVVVVADHAAPEVAASRYVRAFHVVPDATQNPGRMLRFLEDLAAAGERPVLFPTADPDLRMISHNRERLRRSFRLVVGPRDVVDTCSDKARFLQAAEAHALPVPRTWAPADLRGLRRLAARVTYPVVLKPANPEAWSRPALQPLVAGRKALVLHSPAALLDWASRLYERCAEDPQWLVQEYIVGPDDAHYSTHAYVDASGRVRALFTGRKVRIQPIGAGSGCFVRSVHVEDLESATRRILERLGLRGIAVLNFKRDARDGRFVLHEINPRISQWNALPTACGVDVPWLAYAEAAGRTLEDAPAPRIGRQYVDLRNDAKALAAYRVRGTWTARTWLGSLLAHRTVHQLLAIDDPAPAAWMLQRLLRRAPALLARWVARGRGRAVASPEAAATRRGADLLDAWAGQDPPHTGCTHVPPRGHDDTTAPQPCAQCTPSTTEAAS